MQALLYFERRQESRNLPLINMRRFNSIEKSEYMRKVEKERNTEESFNSPSSLQLLDEFSIRDPVKNRFNCNKYSGQ